MSNKEIDHWWHYPAWNKGKKWSEESKKKMSEAKKGKTSWIKDKHHTNESKEKMSIAKKGKHRVYDSTGHYHYE